MHDKADLKQVGVSVDFGFLKLNTSWEADPRERQAAWEIYVEIMSRVSVAPLVEDAGLMREALSSLHSLFGLTRSVLKEAGPDIGTQRGSVGFIALVMLNYTLRPFLSKWHPALLDWESARVEGGSHVAHEKAWPRYKELRAELEEMRQQVSKYAQAFASIATAENIAKVEDLND